jgi:hypothetical protein
LNQSLTPETDSNVEIKPNFNQDKIARDTELTFYKRQTGIIIQDGRLEHQKL